MGLTNSPLKILKRTFKITYINYGIECHRGHIFLNLLRQSLFPRKMVVSVFQEYLQQKTELHKWWQSFTLNQTWKEFSTRIHMVTDLTNQLYKRQRSLEKGVGEKIGCWNSTSKVYSIISITISYSKWLKSTQRKNGCYFISEDG